MDLNGPSGATNLCSTVTSKKCIVHSLSRSIAPLGGSATRLVLLSTRCQLQTSTARQSLSPARAAARSSFAESSSSSSPYTPCKTAYERHQASCSTSSKQQFPVSWQRSTLRLRHAPLDRRWHGQSSIACLSDAVGPLAGDSEAPYGARSSEEHSLQQGDGPQVRPSLPSCMPSNLWNAEHVLIVMCILAQPLLQVPWTAGKIFEVHLLPLNTYTEIQNKQCRPSEHLITGDHCMHQHFASSSYGAVLQRRHTWLMTTLLARLAASTASAGHLVFFCR